MEAPRSLPELAKTQFAGMFSVPRPLDAAATAMPVPRPPRPSSAERSASLGIRQPKPWRASPRAPAQMVLEYYAQKGFRIRAREPLGNHMESCN